MRLKSIQIIIILLITFVFASCNASFGEKYTLGNLEIYYTPENVPKRYVEALGEYFRKNDLILDHKHSVQLTGDEKSHILRMIETEEGAGFPAEERYQLDLLERDIKANVFNGLEFRIEICNANFVPLNVAQSSTN